MTNVLRTTAVAAILALAPLTASALTTAVNGQTYDILADSYEFNQNFTIGSAANLSFGFKNTSMTEVAVSFFGWTVQQNIAAFTGGVAVNFGPYSATIAQGISGGDNTTFNIAAGQTATLTFVGGSVFDTGPKNSTDVTSINFSVQAEVAPVPVPAAGLMLLTALGGVAAMRRRKTA